MSSRKVTAVSYDRSVVQKGRNLLENDHDGQNVELLDQENDEKVSCFPR